MAKIPTVSSDGTEKKLDRNFWFCLLSILICLCIAVSVAGIKLFDFKHVSIRIKSECRKVEIQTNNLINSKAVNQSSIFPDIRLLMRLFKIPICATPICILISFVNILSVYFPVHS